MTIGITGADGFLGRHIQWFFATKANQVSFVSVSRALFSDDASLKKALETCDVIVHCIKAHAANTRESEIYEANLSSGRKLVSVCEQFEKKPRIIFLSSVQALKYDTPYQMAMRDVSNLFNEYGHKNEVLISSLLVPNEFGEWGKPFHVSVVSTFCHQLVKGVSSIVNSNALVTLVHAQEVAQKVFDLILNPVPGDVAVDGSEKYVSEVYEILSNFKEAYMERGIVPNFKDSLQLALFNTLRSHIFTDTTFYPKTITPHEDYRGSLFEIVKEQTGGQIINSSTKPGFTRGNHYHTRKIERFCVLQGEAEIKLKQPFTNLEAIFKVSGSEPQYIDMPTFCAHAITNIGKGDLLTSFWCNEIFNSEDADTYPFDVYQ